MERYILKDIPNLTDIGNYEKAGGFGSLRDALLMGSRSVIEEIKRSGLRGRGGSYFPTHIKWELAAADPATPKYLVCNADEGEPGTFKDRAIIENNPFLLIEGMAISAIALGAESGFIYLRHEYPKSYKILLDTIGQAYAKGYLGDNVLDSGKVFHLQVHRGAGGYICGEETALLESLEGRRPQPRVKPPFPVNRGYFAKPTVVNNVETLANVPVILEIGSGAYAKIGSPGCPGPKLFSVSGFVEKPGVYELPTGTTLNELLNEHAGGVKDGKRLKAVIPGGVSSPVLTPDKLHCRLDNLSLSECGSMLGSGAVIVFDETSCMVRTAKRIAEFFEHESCAKCIPCREGISWMSSVLANIEGGRGNPGDVELLLDIVSNVEGKTFCPMGTSAAIVVKSFINRFREEFDNHISDRGCAFITPTVLL